MEEKKEKEKKMETNSRSLWEYLKDGNVAFFGYAPKTFPDFVFGERKGRIRVFLKNKRVYSFPQKKNLKVSYYSNLSEVRDEIADVYFLDNEAVKVLFAEFPAAAHYCLVRLVPKMSWFIALPGLLRRLFIGLVTVEGIVKLKEGEHDKMWLVLKHQLRESLNTRLSLSSEVGIQGFLDFLRKGNIQYVVLRFFEKLPQLNRDGGDLDILVTDEDDQKIRDFLQAHPGPIGVDVWTVSRSKHNDITYFPPPLARKIIESAIDGPAGSKIPSPKELFFSLAYHVLYHKGVFAGVTSSLRGVEVNKHPENDYAGVLARMAREIGLNIKITMESLDEYLEEEGWRPKIDTLAKIAPRNKWVWMRFFSREQGEEIGLGVLILKQKMHDISATDSVLRIIADYDGFKILRTKKFNVEEVRRVADSLRGGAWNDVSGSVQDYLPYMAVLVLDTNMARSNKMNMVHNNPDRGIIHLKKILRKKFSVGKINLIHSTDNTREAWEYAAVCFPNELDAIKKEAEHAYADIGSSLMDRALLVVKFFPRFCVYHFAIFKRNVRGRIVDWAVK